MGRHGGIEVLRALEERNEKVDDPLGALQVVTSERPVGAVLDQAQLEAETMGLGIELFGELPETVEGLDDANQLPVEWFGIVEVVDLSLLEGRDEQLEALPTFLDLLGTGRVQLRVELEARVVNEEVVDGLHPLGDDVLVPVDLVGDEALLHNRLRHETGG